LLDSRVVILVKREGIPFHGFVNLFHEGRFQVLTGIDSLDHLAEVFECHLGLCSVGVMQARLHHHRSVGKQVDTLSSHFTLAAIRAFRVVTGELKAELFHDSVDALALTWQSKALEDHLERIDVGHVL